MMRECYESLDRAVTRPDCPIRSWTDAFTPSPSVGLATRTSGHWREWNAVFAPNDELPGEPDQSTKPMDPITFVVRSQQLVREFLGSLGDDESDEGSLTMGTNPRPPQRPQRPQPLARLVRRCVDAAAAVALEAVELSLSRRRPISATPFRGWNQLSHSSNLCAAVSGRPYRAVRTGAGSSSCSTSLQPACGAFLPMVS